MATRPIVELDFDSIKSELIDFIKGNPAFTDYNFEGSALNAVMDILAYNTHYNAFYANMVHNESFLDTAQTRGSVVSRAKELGYTPRSTAASTAFVDINVLGVNSSIQSFLLTRGTSFQGKNDNGTFSFLVSKDYTVLKSGTQYLFNDVELKEGVLLSNIFRVSSLNDSSRQIFTIPNKDIDIDTLQVFVRENETSTSTSRVEYFKKNDSFGLNPDSRSFFVQEAYDGRYQIYFGDDVLGKRLNSTNIVDVSYIVSTNKDLANGCTTFSFDGTIGPSQSIQITTTQTSFGGRDKETIDSIKFNSVKFNSARNRSVAADDYSALLKDKFSFIKSVNTFGGQDADPPVYGKVFVCIQPESGLLLSDSVKTNVILPVIKESSVLTILPEILDPSYTSISLEINLKFNRNKTARTEAEVKNLVASTVNSYFEQNVNTFNKDYLESELSSVITEADAGIASVGISKEMGSEIFPVTGTVTAYELRFNNEILKSSIRSSYFVVNIAGIPTVCFVRDNPTDLTTTVDRRGITRTFGALELIDKDFNFIEKLGTVEYSSSVSPRNAGTLRFELRVDSFLDIFVPKIVFYAKTNTDDVLSSRNQIIYLDTNAKNVVSGIKEGTTITTEVYER